jgi:glycerophosphoryl diester phosphodiesterase
VILLDPIARPVIGHRGASGKFPENTVLAFREALARGADALELDVRVSRDGAAMVIHDATLDRTTDGSGPVVELALEELRTLDAGRGEGIPTLDQVLEEFPRTPLILEIKEVRVAQHAVACLLHHGATERVLVGSFQSQALAPFDGPRFHRSASRRETALAWAASRVGVGVPGGYEAFTVPEQHGSLTIVDARFATAARRRARPVHVWTVDDPLQARRLRSAGVCGIITNFPDRMCTLEQ